MEDISTTQVSGIDDTITNNKQDGGPPVVFLKEEAFFRGRKPHYTEYLKHAEMFISVSHVIDKSHITGLQRVNGLWRLYLDNLIDKTTLITEGITIRGHHVPILQTNPYRLDSENTTRIRVQDIPLSADDGQITRTLILKGIDVISCTREKLRIDNKLTNCETGDRIVLVKTLSLKEPLNRFVYVGKYKAKMIHRGQNKTKTPKCTKCLATGHTIDACVYDWTCVRCKTPGHRKGDCPLNDASDGETCETEGNQMPLSTDASLSADDTPENVAPKDTDAGAHEIPCITPTGTPRTSPVRTTPKRAVKKNNKSETGKGQMRIDEIMKNVLTPGRQGRSRSLTRSPPTPPENLHDSAKKSRHGRRDSGRDSGADD